MTTATKPALRLLVTGSRDWTDPESVDAALWDWLIDNGFKSSGKSAGPKPILVVGACLTGADAIAEALWRERGLPVERHPADWKAFGSFAGPKRNKEMAKSGVDFCIAFPKGSSRGTRGCIREAEAAGVQVQVFEADVFEGTHRPIMVDAVAA